VLERSKNADGKPCCEKCRVPNYKVILRGVWGGIEVYQDDDGRVFDANTSEYIGSDYLGEVDPTQKNKLIRVVLTVAHLDGDIENNDLSNLMALCQKCHLQHDDIQHRTNARLTRERKKET
jgi:hypothetical protein